ncbi:MAG: hypothetical protein ABI837_06340 [Acidobacteriota bacterium]
MKSSRILLTLLFVVVSLGAAGCSSIVMPSRALLQVGDPQYHLTENFAHNCGNTVQQTLGVKKGDGHIKPGKAKHSLLYGDCVWFQTKAEDGSSPATQITIHFINKGDANHYGKQPNDNDAAELACPPKADGCIVFPNLQPGSYRYVVKVMHDGVEKVSDPEIIISCSTCLDLWKSDQQ